MEIEEVTPKGPQPEIDLAFSDTVGKLVSALAKAHKKFKAVKKTSANPFFKSKYADLAEVLDATSDCLSDNDLAVIQAPGAYAEGKVKLTTVLAHSSGEWIKSVLYMPVSKADAQGVGSAITYARRYAYSAIVNVASEADDDGNGAVSGKKREEIVADRMQEMDESEFDQRTEGQRLIAAFQVSAIIDACDKTGKGTALQAKWLSEHGQRKGWGELTRAEFNDAIKWAHSNTAQTDLVGLVLKSAEIAKAKRNGAVLSKCFTHGMYAGEGNCPKCEAAQ